VAVVFTHAGRAGLAFSGWSADFVLTSLWTRFQVPAFLFVSGFLYARAEGLRAPEVGRRTKRILEPYLVASLVALALAWVAVPAMRFPPPVGGVGEVLWRLVSGSALGIYYYVFLVVVSFLLMWPLSRAGRAGAWLPVIVGAFLVLAIDRHWMVAPAWHISSWLPGDTLFWRVRDPFDKFHLGYFAAGWLAALHLPALRRWADTRAPLLWCLCAVGVVWGWLSLTLMSPVPLGGFARVIYTFAVIGGVTLATRSRPAGPWVRFLGDTSLCLYLYHRIFQLLVQPATDALPPVLRIGGQVAVGLLCAVGVAWAGRRLLGADRARRFLGA